MLVSRGKFERGEVRVETTLVLLRTLRAQLTRRSGVLVDSRFLRGGAPPADVATIYVVGTGHMKTSLGEAAPPGASAWVLGVNEFERCMGQGATFRSWGEPALVMDVRVPRAAVAADVGLSKPPRALPPDVTAAMHELVDGPEPRASFGRVLAALTAAGVLSAGFDARIDEPEPDHVARLWDAMRTAYERHDTGAYLKLFTEVVQLSPRQIQRDLAELAERFGLGGYRAMVRAMRLRRAVVLLSAANLSVKEVAGLVGYGSSDAMGRAFRDAQLPAPSAVRAELLAVRAALASGGSRS